MEQEPDIETLARTIGDPTRIKMLTLLMEGRALTAKELAYGAGVEPATATAHLKRLLDERLVSVAVQGRHKYVRLGLARNRPADGIDDGGGAARQRPPPGARGSRSRCATRRMCYDHLAGELGIGITDGLVKQGILRKEEDAFAVTRKGADWFGDLGHRPRQDPRPAPQVRLAMPRLERAPRPSRRRARRGAGGAVRRPRLDRPQAQLARGERDGSRRRKLAEHFALEP